MTITRILSNSLHRCPLTKVRQVSSFLDETPKGVVIHLLIYGQDGATEMRIPVTNMEHTLALMVKTPNLKVQGMVSDVRSLLTTLTSDLTSAGFTLSPNGTWDTQIAA